MGQNSSADWVRICGVMDYRFGILCSWSLLLYLHLTNLTTKGSRGATRNLNSGVLNFFWGKAPPPLVSSAFHSPPSSCTRCFPTTLNMSSLPPTHLKAGGLGFSPEFFKMSTLL